MRRLFDAFVRIRIFCSILLSYALVQILFTGISDVLILVFFLFQFFLFNFIGNCVMKWRKLLINFFFRFTKQFVWFDFQFSKVFHFWFWIWNLSSMEFFSQRIEKLCLEQRLSVGRWNRLWKWGPRRLVHEMQTEMMWSARNGFACDIRRSLEMDFLPGVSSLWRPPFEIKRWRLSAPPPQEILKN